MRKNLFLGVFLLVVFLASWYFLYMQLTDISVVPRASGAQSELQKKPVVYFGVISRYSPHILYEGYQPLMDYLTEKTAYHFKLRLSHSYRETIEQLKSRRVAAAFLGTYIYLRSRRKAHLHCILKPLNREGRPFFHSVLVAPENSSIRSIRDLAGKRLALPSPLSYSAHWLSTQAGFQMKQLDSAHYFDFHNTVIYELLKGNFDAGVVKDRVANEFLEKGIHIVARSRLIPASPIVVSDRTDPLITEAITNTLLQIDIRQAQYQKLVRNWDAEFQNGFMIAKDSDYEQAGL